MRNEKGFTLIELLIVVAIIGIIAAIAIPSLLNALDRARQTTSVENVKAMGQNVEQYIMDHNRVGAPKVATIQDLQDIFVDTEINLNEGMTKDGWGTELEYSNDGGAGDRGYSVISLGSDSVVSANEADGIITKFITDIKWSNGRFIQRPEGAQKSGR